MGSNRYNNLGKKKVLATVIPLLMAVQVHAVEFETAGVSFNLDSSLAIGSSWRTEDAVLENTQNTDGHNANADDSNRNYLKGDAFSQTFTGNHTLRFEYENFGGTVSGKYWYDSAIANNSVEHGHGATYTPTALGTDYSNAAGKLDDSGFDDLNKAQGAYLMDAFVYGSFEVADMDLEVRLGRQVLSWGESTFILGGLNQITSFDVAGLMRPGAQIKDALLPSNMAYANLGLSEDMSLEAFYKLEHQDNNIPACGTFFAFSDYVSNGCNTLIIKDGLASLDRHANGYRPAKDDGQFGAALRFTVGDVDLGIYAMNVHGTMPSVYLTKSAVAATAPQVVGMASNLAYGGALQGAMADPTNPANATLVALAQGGITDYATLAATAAGDPSMTQMQAAAVKGNIDGSAQAAFTAVYDPTITPDLAQFTLITTSAAMVNSQTANYYVFNSEDNQILGLSFATNVGSVALSGEISHELDYGLQINGPWLTSLALTGVAVHQELTDSYNATEFGGDLQGIREFDVTKAQMTAITTFDQVLGASQIALVAEVGMTHYHDFSEGANELKYGRADLFGLYDSTGATPGSNADDDGFVTQSSWGYRARASANYNNVFSGINLKPILSLSHDVQGYAQYGFQEGNVSLGLAVEASYQDTYTAALSYTARDGGDYSLTKDKDFASLSVGVTF